MDIFIEAGLVSFIALATFVVGMGVTLRSRDPGTTALVFASFIIALGLLGAGMAQRQVEQYVSGVDAIEAKVAALSMGTREATTNHLLSGGMAALILAVGASRRRSRSTES